MSYILEALRKAERERNLGQVPTLEGAAAPEEEIESRPWLWVLVVGLLVNAVVFGVWWLYPRTPAPTVPVAAVETRELSPLPGSSGQRPAVADYLPPPTTVIEEPYSEPPVVAVPESEPEPAPVPARTLSAAPAEPEEEAYEEPAIEATPVTQEITHFRDMPPEFRRSLPEMKIDAHFYTDVPGRSFVMINLRKYKPGERLAEGPQVVEVASDGVILSYQGQQFLLTP